MITNNHSHHRRSIRLKGFDYSQPGGYFITIVTCNREHLFGAINHCGMILNPLGRIVSDCWSAIPDHFMHVDLGEFVVMPNHIHGILNIFDDYRRGTIYRAPALEKRAPAMERFGQPVAGSIPTIIRAFKAAVTRKASRELNLSRVWQRNYFEHIISSDREYERIEAYIANNPSNWLSDDENQSFTVTDIRGL